MCTVVKTQCGLSVLILMYESRLMCENELVKQAPFFFFFKFYFWILSKIKLESERPAEFKIDPYHLGWILHVQIDPNLF